MDSRVCPIALEVSGVPSPAVFCAHQIRRAVAGYESLKSFGA